MKANPSYDHTVQGITRYQRVVADTGEFALSNADPDTVLQEIITAVVSTLQVEYCDVLELLPDGSFLLRGGHGWDEDSIGSLTIEAGQHTLAGATILRRQASITEDFTTDIRYRPTQLQRHHHIVSGVTMLVHNGRPFGVLGIYTTDRRIFSPEEIDFLQSMANILSETMERRELENALRMSEDKYRTLFEESMDVIFFSTASGEFIDINPAGVQLFEFSSKEEIFGINIEQDLYADPADRSLYHRILDENGAVKDFEVRLKTKTGRIVIVQETTTAIRDSRGNVIAYRGIMRDITRLREAQQELHRLFREINACSDALYKAGRNTRFQHLLEMLQESSREGTLLTQQLLAHIYTDPNS